MKNKFEIGDCVFVKNPLDNNIEKTIEAIAYTKDKTYYLTDAIDLAILGYEEDEIILDERQYCKKQIQKKIDKLNDLIFEEKIKLLQLESQS